MSIEALTLKQIILDVGTGGVIGPHYASSKSAIHGLLHWIANRHAKDGIVGSCISMGWKQLTFVVGRLVMQLLQLSSLVRA